MDMLANINELGNKIMSNINLEKFQDDFLNSTVGKIVNSSIDIGLKSLLPDFMEEEVIDVKNAFLTDGFQKGIESAITNTIEVGKKVLNITDAYDDINQIVDSFKNGKLINGISSVIDLTVDGLNSMDVISKEVSDIIKSGKDILVESIENNVSNEFTAEGKIVDKINKYTDNWMNCYKNKDLEGLNKEFKKIQNQIKKIVPLESIINNVNKMININELIKNSEEFDFNEVYLNLAENLK